MLVMPGVPQRFMIAREICDIPRVTRGLPELVEETVEEVPVDSSRSEKQAHSKVLINTLYSKKQEHSNVLINTL